MTSSTTESTRNQENYQRTGNQKSPLNGKEIVLTGALHRAKRISSNFDSELKTLETTFLNAGYPKRFISHTVKSFLEDSSVDDNLISSFLFEERKKIFIKLPYCNRNERLSKTFISKLNKFTGFKYI